jgi:hypothetical protein
MTQFYVRCQSTGMKSPPRETLEAALKAAEKEGFIEIDGKYYHKATDKAKQLLAEKKK